MCSSDLRLRATRMIRALLDEDVADRWASHADDDGDSITPDDLAGLVPAPRDMWRIDDATLACMLQDFAVMSVFAVQSGQFDGRPLLEPLMELQAAACVVARSCEAGSAAAVRAFPRRSAATPAAAAVFCGGAKS